MTGRQGLLLIYVKSGAGAYCGDQGVLIHLSDAELVEACIESASSLAGLINREDVFDTLVVRVKDAYPFYDLAYKEKLRAIVGHLEGAGNLICLGTTGIFKYNNSDGSIEMGVELAARLLRGDPAPSVMDYTSEEVSY